MPILVIDKQYADGAILTEAQLDAALASITTLLNTTGLGADNIQDNSIGSNEIQTSAVTNTKLATNSVSTAKIQDNAITLAKLALALQAYLVPTGLMADWGTSSAPTGWLLCDGGEYVRADYQDLFDKIGVTFGSGNGTTTFNVPDLRGMVRRMPGGAATMDSGALRDPDSAGRLRITDWTTGYTGLGSVQKGAIQSHTHTLTNYFIDASGMGYQTNSGTQRNFTTKTSDATGGNETRMINMYLNVIIKT